LLFLSLFLNSYKCGATDGGAGGTVLLDIVNYLDSVSISENGGASPARS
jgi:hypothetical protein